MTGMKSVTEVATRIVDGRTFVTDSEEHPIIRLAEVTVPRLGELGYSRAKLKLRRLLGGKEVTIAPLDRDEHGRTIAKVMVGSQSANAEMQQID